jgi:hypothetical protein
MAWGNTGRRFLSGKVTIGPSSKRFGPCSSAISLDTYVLISNHFHFLLEVDRCPTARILQSDIREAVFEQGYLSSQGGKFLGSDPQPSACRKVSRVRQV